MLCHCVCVKCIPLVVLTLTVEKHVKASKYYT